MGGIRRLLLAAIACGVLCGVARSDEPRYPRAEDFERNIRWIFLIPDDLPHEPGQYLRLGPNGKLYLCEVSVDPIGPEYQKAGES